MAPYMNPIYRRSRKYAAVQNVAEYDEAKPEVHEIHAAVIAQAINRVASDSIMERAKLIIEAAKRARVMPADLINAINGNQP